MSTKPPETRLQNIEKIVADAHQWYAQDLRYCLSLLKECRGVIGGLLKSSDCAWYEQGGGHDWPIAVESARQTLAKLE